MAPKLPYSVHGAVKPNSKAQNFQFKCKVCAMGVRRSCVKKLPDFFQWITDLDDKEDKEYEVVWERAGQTPMVDKVGRRR